MRLVIGGPSRDTVPASFAFDLAQLYTKTYNSGLWWWVTLGFVQAAYIDVGRETVFRGAIERQATHVLFVDTDMTFPDTTATRLLSRDKPIVAANCLMRDPRHLFTAQRDGQRIETTPESSGLEQVDSVGMGVMLIRTDVVKGMDRPWFRHGWDAWGEVGEDIRFCQAARAQGHSIYIDHDLSKEVGHIGQHTYQPAVRDVAVAHER